MLIVTILGAVALAWLWTCFCTFPMHPWNAIRTAPVLMWASGTSPYPGPGDGPVTTWIYGPLPILALWPVTLATQAATALMIAGVVNILTMLFPVALATRYAMPPTTGIRTWLLACLLVIGLWPSANLIFWQADNLAIAFGLLSLVLLPDKAATHPRHLWLAAAAAVLALWAKPTELGPALGQMVWLGLRVSPRAALVQAARCLACGGAAGITFLLMFGAEGLIYNMFVIPSGLPLVPVLSKAFHPSYLPSIIVGVVLPLAVVVATARRVVRQRDSTALAYLVFVTSLPFNLAGFASIGGNVNSLHGHLYLLPSLAAFLARAELRPIMMPRLPLTAWVAAVGLGVHFTTAAVRPVTPTTGGAIQAEMLARQFAGKLYLPWHPLATYYAEQRFDHAEDGIVTRSLAGRPLSGATVHAHLPPAYSMVAYNEFIYDGFVASQLVPLDATLHQSGDWVVLSWNPSGTPLAIPAPLKFAPDEPTSLHPSTLRP